MSEVDFESGKDWDDLDAIYNALESRTSHGSKIDPKANQCVTRLLASLIDMTLSHQSTELTAKAESIQELFETLADSRILDTSPVFLAGRLSALHDAMKFASNRLDDNFVEGQVLAEGIDLDEKIPSGPF